MKISVGFLQKPRNRYTMWSGYTTLGHIPKEVYIHVWVCVYIYIHKYTYTHIYTFINIHVYSLIEVHCFFIHYRHMDSSFSTWLNFNRLQHGLSKDRRHQPGLLPNTGHRHHDCPWWQHTKDINMTSRATQAMGTDMVVVSGVSLPYSHQHGHW